jgi:hypothetical protein
MGRDAFRAILTLGFQTLSSSHQIGGAAIDRFFFCPFPSVARILLLEPTLFLGSTEINHSRGLAIRESGNVVNIRLHLRLQTDRAPWLPPTPP